MPETESVLENFLICALNSSLLRKPIRHLQFHSLRSFQALNYPNLSLPLGYTLQSISPSPCADAPTVNRGLTHSQCWELCAEARQPYPVSSLHLLLLASSYAMSDQPSLLPVAVHSCPGRGHFTTPSGGNNTLSEQNRRNRRLKVTTMGLHRVQSRSLTSSLERVLLTQVSSRILLEAWAFKP